MRILFSGTALRKQHHDKVEENRWRVETKTCQTASGSWSSRAPSQDSRNETLVLFPISHHLPHLTTASHFSPSSLTYPNTHTHTHIHSYPGGPHLLVHVYTHKPDSEACRPICLCSFVNDRFRPVMGSADALIRNGNSVYGEHDDNGCLYEVNEQDVMYQFPRAQIHMMMLCSSNSWRRPWL